MAAAPESIPVDVVRRLVAAYGVDVHANQFDMENCRPAITEPSKRCNGTLLHKAAEDGDVSMVEAALAVGCEVDRPDSIGVSALQTSAWYGHVGVVRVLLAAGAHPDGVSSPMDPPLACAAGRGHIDIMRALIEAGADVALVDPRDGETALHLAAFRGRSAAIQVLLDAGAPVDSHGEHVPTPLHYALCYGSRNCLGPLLRAGATLDNTWHFRRLRRNEQNASAFRYMERVEAAGGYAQLVGTYRRVLTAPQSCLSWFLKVHCEFRFGLGAFPHDLVPLVLEFWKPPGGP